MIRTESLTKYFGARCAVREFDVEIASREVVGFLGLNGAGKTTALRLLAGLLAPSGGRVLIDGADLAGPDGARARSRIGFLPDRPPLYDEMTVTGFLRFAARLRGHPGDDARIDAVIERTGLADRAEETVGHLSHGYRQRVGIAQAIVHDPALVILDEPMSGLDPKQIVDMRALVRSLGEDHTVLLSSHNLNEVSETCDQILVIDEGRLEAQGAPTELAEKLGGGSSRLELTLVGATEEVEASLRIAEAQGLVASSARRGGPRVHEIEVDLACPPEDLARALVEAGLGLRRMESATSALEGLFAELTRRAS